MEGYGAIFLPALSRALDVSGRAGGRWLIRQELLKQARRYVHSLTGFPASAPVSSPTGYGAGNGAGVVAPEETGAVGAGSLYTLTREGQEGSRRRLGAPLREWGVGLLADPAARRARPSSASMSKRRRRHTGARRRPVQLVIDGPRPHPLLHSRAGFSSVTRTAPLGIGAPRNGDRAGWPLRQKKNPVAAASGAGTLRAHTLDVP